MEELMLLENPYYRNRRRKRRNPMARGFALPSTMREWTQGVDLMDAGAAVGGLAAATMIPGMIVTSTATMGQKLWKLTVALGCAVGAGALGRAMISPSAGKAAIIGGVAGTSAQALGMFTNIQIGQRGRLGGGLGSAVNVTPAHSRSEEVVQLIRP